ncbi:MAG: hypothetical protein OJF50_006718 [Nitrospira sp.]|jgi:excisionase family DNA binding protein|nr:hypothetical protein [Nitrospira sp.]
MKLQASDLLTVNETAVRLNLKPATIRKWMVQRRAPYTKVSGRAVRIPRDWVEAKIRDGWREAVEPGSVVSVT